MVIWSNPAKKDLQNIFEYVAQDSDYYAQKVVDSIVSKANTLEFLPTKGRIHTD